jgi:hypothetical protein
MMVSSLLAIAPDSQMKQAVDRDQFVLPKLNGTNNTLAMKLKVPSGFYGNLNHICENAKSFPTVFSFLFFSFGFSTSRGERKSARPAYACA